MILVLVLSLVVASVSAASAPAAPGRVEVQAGVLSWSPAPEENTTHSVQFREFDKNKWVDLPRCSGTAATSCDVSSRIQKANHGCVRFRVQAQRGQLRSETEACSPKEDRCTPQFRLTAAPGSITVHLTRDHALHRESADHAEHCVSHWVQDEPKPEHCTLSPASLVLRDLDPGQNYCVDVQYWHFKTAEGVPRCPVCLQVPRATSKNATIVLGTVLPVLALVLLCGAVYVLNFHKNKVQKCKKWFKPEREPDCLALPLEGATVCTTPEEHCSIITGFRQIDQD